MNARSTAVARACLEGAEADTLDFPQILALLGQAEFEGYSVDFRAARATYYLRDGTSIALATHGTAAPVAPAFDVESVRAAIRDAQQRVPGYSYKGFCDRVAAAGCAGYVVSLSGRRAVYLGRTAETHVEHFPA